MREIEMSESDKRSFEKALEYCREWCGKNQWAVGAGEMALGAGLIAWGLQSAHIAMGADIVASKLSSLDEIGASSGAGLGAIGASFLGSIGVAGLGSAIAVPAIALIGGGAVVFGLFGYAVGDAAQEFLTPSHGFGDFFFGASIVAVGVALMIDGAKRFITDQKVLALLSKLKDGVIQLATLTSGIVARTWDELQAFITELAEHPEANDIALSLTSGTTAATGAVIGGSIAAGSITVLGSHGLGAVALSLGLVSAPVWPVIAGGAAGLAVGVAAWKGVKSIYSSGGSSKSKKSNSPE